MIHEGRRAPDLGMPNQAGNNLLFALVKKAKSERQLLSMIDKLALKMNGKYKDAKDELITRAAIDTWNYRSPRSYQSSADRNVMMQLKSVEDLGSGEIKLDDKTKVKMNKPLAGKILVGLMNLKPAARVTALKSMQRTKSGFEKEIKKLVR